MATITTEFTFKWLYNDTVDHYYRVESKCAARTCPPLNDDAPFCTNNGGSRVSVLVLAKSLTEVCEKLIRDGWVFEVAQVHRIDPPARMSDWSEEDSVSCRTFVDVTEEFNETAACLTLLSPPEEEVEEEESTTTDLVSDTVLIASACCETNTNPAILNLQHNFSRLNNLSQFLYRNNLQMPLNIGLIYNANTGTWLSNLLFTGIAVDSNTVQQNWNLLLEFGCVGSSFSSTELVSNENFWKLSFNVTITSPTTSVTNSRSRILLFFHPEDVCASNRRVSFTFNFDVSTQESNPPAAITPILNDGIGLFNSITWRNNPFLTMKIHATDPTTSNIGIYPELRLPIGDVRGANPNRGI